MVFRIPFNISFSYMAWNEGVTEFDDGLFDALVRKVVIKSGGEFEFWFDDGEIIIVRA